MTIPPAIATFAWQQSYEMFRATASDAKRERAVALADRFDARCACHVEFAELVRGERMGGWRAVQYGAPDLFGNEFFELGGWLDRAARLLAEVKRRPILHAAVDAVPAPEELFEIDPDLELRLPAEGIAFARLIVPRQPSRRLVIAPGVLVGATAGMFRADDDSSRVVLDVGTCDEAGPEQLVSTFGHELAHGCDPDIESPDNEEFARHLGPLLVAEWPATLDELDLLTAEAVETIGRARVEPIDTNDEIDDLLEFVHAPLKRVPNAAAARAFPGDGGAAIGAAPVVNASVQREAPSAAATPSTNAGEL